MPPMSGSSSSALVSTASIPMAAPSASEPASPMKTSAGWQLNQRNPMAAPISAPQNTDSSPAPRTLRIFR